MANSLSELDEFKNEAYELLDVAEKSLMGLDQGKDFKDCYNAIFRSLHNLKGGSGMMEMLELQQHTHELETIFTQFQDKGQIPYEYLSFFLKGVDAARLILAGEHVQFDYSVKKVPAVKKIVIQEEAPKESLTKGFSTEEFIMNCSDYTENILKNLHLIESGKDNNETLNDLYREVHSLKGDAYLFSFNLIGDVAHAMENALEPVRDGRLKVNKKLMSCLFKSVDVIELFLNLKEKTKEPTPALKKIKVFAKLKGPLRCPIIIVQHMPPIFTATLAERLGKLTGIAAAEAQDKEELKNRIYVAPGNFHLRLTGSRAKPVLTLDQNDHINFVRPAVDPLFQTASDLFKEGCLGIVLTGMGQDGKDGTVQIKNNDGVVIIQNPESCVVFGMPGAVKTQGSFDFIKTPEELSDILVDKAQANF